MLQTGVGAPVTGNNDAEKEMAVMKKELGEDKMPIGTTSVGAGRYAPSGKGVVSDTHDVAASPHRKADDDGNSTPPGGKEPAAVKADDVATLPTEKEPALGKGDEEPPTLLADGLATPPAQKESASDKDVGIATPPSKNEPALEKAEGLATPPNKQEPPADDTATSPTKNEPASDKAEPTTLKADSLATPPAQTEPASDKDDGIATPPSQNEPTLVKAEGLATPPNKQELPADDIATLPTKNEPASDIADEKEPTTAKADGVAAPPAKEELALDRDDDVATQPSKKEPAPANAEDAATPPSKKEPAPVKSDGTATPALGKDSEIATPNIKTIAIKTHNFTDLPSKAEAGAYDEIWTEADDIATVAKDTLPKEKELQALKYDLTYMLRNEKWAREKLHNMGGEQVAVPGKDSPTNAEDQKPTAANGSATNTEVRGWFNWLR